MFRSERKLKCNCPKLKWSVAYEPKRNQSNVLIRFNYVLDSFGSWLGFMSKNRLNNYVKLWYAKLTKTNIQVIQNKEQSNLQSPFILYDLCQISFFFPIFNLCLISNKKNVQTLNEIEVTAILENLSYKAE